MCRVCDLLEVSFPILRTPSVLQINNGENSKPRKKLWRNNHGHIGSNQMNQNVEPNTFFKRGSHIFLQKQENVEYPGYRVVDI